MTESSLPQQHPSSSRRSIPLATLAVGLVAGALFAKSCCVSEEKNNCCPCPDTSVLACYDPSRSDAGSTSLGDGSVSRDGGSADAGTRYHDKHDGGSPSHSHPGDKHQRDGGLEHRLDGGTRHHSGTDRPNKGPHSPDQRDAGSDEFPHEDERDAGSTSDGHTPQQRDGGSADRPLPIRSRSENYLTGLDCSMPLSLPYLGITKKLDHTVQTCAVTAYQKYLSTAAPASTTPTVDLYFLRNQLVIRDVRGSEFFFAHDLAACYEPFVRTKLRQFSQKSCLHYELTFHNKQKASRKR